MRIPRPRSSIIETCTGSLAFRRLVVIVWAAASVAGIAGLSRLESAPGAQRSAPTKWTAKQLERLGDLDHERWNLVVFAHPKCPCMRATIENLDQLLVESGDRIATKAVFFLDPNAEASWAFTDTWDRARRLPRTSTFEDRGGGIAADFGAATSGDVFLFDPDGALRFRGGLTSARGHAGGSIGVKAVLDLVQGRGGDRSSTPVFGCPIEEER